MGSVRRHVRRVAGTWLVLQILVTTWVPVALYASIDHESAQRECTCEHPTGGICPMHRHSTSTPSPTTGCAVRSALDPFDALVTSIIGPIGVLPYFVTSITLPDTSVALAPPERTPLDQTGPPDSPPPRA